MLHNAEQRTHRREKELQDRGLPSDDAGAESLQEVRLPLAPLLEMPDERRDLEAAARRRDIELERVAHLARDVARELAAAHAALTALDPSDREGRGRLQDASWMLMHKRERLSRESNALRDAKDGLRARLEPLDARAPQVEQLLRWASENFPALAMTIDGAK